MTAMMVFPEPVGGGGETHTTRSNGEREDLANHDPGTRSPGRCEEEDEDGDEGDLSIDSREVVGALVALSRTAVVVGVVEPDARHQ